MKTCQILLSRPSDNKSRYHTHTYIHTTHMPAPMPKSMQCITIMSNDLNTSERQVEAPHKTLQKLISLVSLMPLMSPIKPHGMHVKVWAAPCMDSNRAASCLVKFISCARTGKWVSTASVPCSNAVPRHEHHHGNYPYVVAWYLSVVLRLTPVMECLFFSV